MGIKNLKSIKCRVFRLPADGESIPVYGDWQGVDSAMPFYQLPKDSVGLIKNMSNQFVLLTPGRPKDRIHELHALEAAFEGLEFTSDKARRDLVELLISNDTIHSTFAERLGACPECGSKIMHPLCMFFPDAELRVTCLDCGHREIARGQNPSRALEILAKQWAYHKEVKEVKEAIHPAIASAVAPIIDAALRQRVEKANAMEQAADIISAATKPIARSAMPDNPAMADAFAAAAALV